MTPPDHQILLVEDSADDAFFVEYALKKASIPHAVHLVVNGEAAMDYLQGKGPYADRAKFPLPSVIFLDLKLPGLHGFEVLSWIRGQPALRKVPVFILTGSSEDHDRAKAQQLGAEGYLVKPPDGPMLLEAMKSLNSQTSIPPARVSPG